MIVLDADSVLSVDTLLTLVREMAADPKLGLSADRASAMRGHTLFARLQQFAGAVTGRSWRAGSRRGPETMATTGGVDIAS